MYKFLKIAFYTIVLLGSVSTLVGDHLGIPCVVDFPFRFKILNKKHCSVNNVH